MEESRRFELHNQETQKSFKSLRGESSKESEKRHFRWSERPRGVVTCNQTVKSDSEWLEGDLRDEVFYGIGESDLTGRFLQLWA